MPSTLTYPGVYIEEVPSGVRTIVGVGTSTAAFLGSFSRGPLNEAVRLFGFADFEREFGGLRSDSEASYAIQQFFLNGGTEAWAVRVAGGTGASAARASSGVLTNAAGATVMNVSAGRRIRGESAEDPGTWGDNLRLEVDYDTRDPRALFNLTVAEVVSLDGRFVVRQTETFRNLSVDPGASNHALDVVNAGSRLVQLDRDGLPALPDPFPGPGDAGLADLLPAASGTTGDVLADPDAIPADGSTFDVTVDIDGSTTTATATLDYGGAAPTTYLGLRSFLQSAIRAAADPATDAFPFLSTATVRLLGSGATERFSVVLGGRTHAAFRAGMTATFSAGADAVGLDPAGVEGQLVELSGGNDGLAPDGAALNGSELDHTGLYALDDVDLFNVLSIPSAVAIAGDDGTAMRDVYGRAAAYCERRRAFLLVDVPASTDTLDDAQTWMTENDGLRHKNAAVYFPRPLVADPLADNRLRSVAASGTMAGLYARTDTARGVWKAPAGTEARLRGVQALAVTLTDLENGALNPLGVNVLRRFPVYGRVAWGARTLVGADRLASEWKYVPVRRLALFLEESLFRGTQWVVFEPNDEPLWAQIRLNVGAFLHGLFRQGAFQGTTPREAYFVKCDRETTTQSDIDRGIVNVVVGFAPLKPAEFVVLQIQQIAGDLEV